MIHAHAAARLDKGRPFGSAGKGGDLEELVVGNHLVGSRSVLVEALLVGGTGRHAQCGMGLLIILCVSPKARPFCQRGQGPHTKFSGIGGAGEGAWLLRRLGIAEQMVNELGIYGPEEPFLGAPYRGSEEGRWCFLTR